MYQELKQEILRLCKNYEVRQSQCGYEIYKEPLRIQLNEYDFNNSDTIYELFVKKAGICIYRNSATFLHKDKAQSESNAQDLHDIYIAMRNKEQRQRSSVNAMSICKSAVKTLNEIRTVFGTCKIK